MSIDSSGRYSPGSSRQAPPWKKTPTAPRLPLEWHHVIPLAMLRNCWQALAMNLDQPKCQVALQSYLRLLKVDAPRVWTKEMATRSLSFDQQEFLDGQIARPSWNIVEGPQRRVDDAKAGDVLDEFTAGLTATEQNRQRRLADLFQAMKSFNKASADGSMNEITAQAIANVMNQVERTLVAGGLIRFRPAMWTEANAPSLIPRGAEKAVWWKKKAGNSRYEGHPVLFTPQSGQIPG